MNPRAVLFYRLFVADCSWPRQSCGNNERQTDGDRERVEMVAGERDNDGTYGTVPVECGT